MNIHELPLQSAEVGKISLALAKAQAEIKQPKKTIRVRQELKNGRVIDYKYADLNDVIESYRTALGNQELVIIQRIITVNEQTETIPNVQNEWNKPKSASQSEYLLTTLVHSSGEFFQTWVKLHNRSMGVQEFASEITYQRRYQVSALVGVASEIDDDGQSAASGEEEKGKATSTDNGKTTPADDKKTKPNNSTKQNQTPPPQPPGGNKAGKKEFTNEQILNVLDKDLVQCTEKPYAADEIQKVKERWEKQKDFFVEKGIYDTGLEKIQMAFDIAEGTPTEEDMAGELIEEDSSDQSAS